MPRSEFLTEAVKFGLPFGILIYYLGIVQTTVMTAALYTAVSMILTGVSVPILQSVIGAADETPFQALKSGLWGTVNGAREGFIVLAPVTIILSAINAVVDILTTTGVPGAISLALMDLSGGELAIAAVLGMVICIIMGLGMPVTASYTIVALLVAPTFVNDFFLPELAAHFFVFYAAILSSVTPPIATACAVACGIAKADFWKTCYEAIKISAPLFVLPFVFVFHTEIVSAELNVPTLTTSVYALFGSVAIIHGINYRFDFPLPVTVGARGAFFTAGVVTMVHPSRTVQTVGLGVLVGFYLLQVAFGQPNPVGKLRTAVAALNASADEADEPDPDRAR